MSYIAKKRFNAMNLFIRDYHVFACPPRRCVHAVCEGRSRLEIGPFYFNEVSTPKAETNNKPTEDKPPGNEKMENKPSNEGDKNSNPTKIEHEKPLKSAHDRPEFFIGEEKIEIPTPREGLATKPTIVVHPSLSRPTTLNVRPQQRTTTAVETMNELRNTLAVKADVKQPVKLVVPPTKQIDKNLSGDFGRFTGLHLPPDPACEAVKSTHPAPMNSQIIAGQQNNPVSNMWASRVSPAPVMDSLSVPAKRTHTALVTPILSASHTSVVPSRIASMEGRRNNNPWPTFCAFFFALLLYFCYVYTVAFLFSKAVVPASALGTKLDPVESGGDPMICHVHNLKTFFTIPHVKPCAVAPITIENAPEKVQLEIYKFNFIKHRTSAWHCSRVYPLKEALAWFFNDNHIFREETRNIPVTDIQCTRMQRNKKCELNKYLLNTWNDEDFDPKEFSEEMPEDNGLYSSRNTCPSFWPTGGMNCCKWQRRSVENCYLRRTAVYKTYGNAEMESTCGGNVSHCNYDHGKCQLEDGSHLLWEKNSNTQCRYMKWKRVIGKQWGVNFLAEDRGIALTFRDAQVISQCEGEVIGPISDGEDDNRLILSDQGVAVKVIGSQKWFNSLQDTLRAQKLKLARGELEPDLEIGSPGSNLMTESIKLRFRRSKALKEVTRRKQRIRMVNGRMVEPEFIKPQIMRIGREPRALDADELPSEAIQEDQEWETEYEWNNPDIGDTILNSVLPGDHDNETQHLDRQQLTDELLRIYPENGSGEEFIEPILHPYWAGNNESFSADPLFVKHNLTWRDASLNTELLLRKMEADPELAAKLSQICRAVNYMRELQEENDTAEADLHWLQNETQRVRRSVESELQQRVRSGEVYARQPTSRDPNPSPSLVTTDVLATSIQHAYTMIMEQLKYQFQQGMTGTCQNLAFMMQIVQASLMTNPTRAMQVILGNKHIMARSGGNLVEVIPCVPLDVQRMSFLSMGNQTCTKYIPVAYEVSTNPSMHKKGYLDPVTKVVHENSELANCGHSQLIPLQIRDKYYVYKAIEGGIHEIPHIQQLVMFVPNATTAWVESSHIFKQLIMYNMSEFRDRISSNEMLHSAALMFRIYGKYGHFPRDAYDNNTISNPWDHITPSNMQDYIAGMYREGLGGMLKGWGMNAFHILVGIIVTYVILQALVAHCMPNPAAFGQYLNLPALAAKCGESARHARYRHHSHDSDFERMNENMELRHGLRSPRPYIAGSSPETDTSAPLFAASPNDSTDTAVGTQVTPDTTQDSLQEYLGSPFHASQRSGNLISPRDEEIGDTPKAQPRRILSARRRLNFIKPNFSVMDNLRHLSAVVKRNREVAERKDVNAREKIEANVNRITAGNQYGNLCRAAGYNITCADHCDYKDSVCPSLLTGDLADRCVLRDTSNTYDANPPLCPGEPREYLPQIVVESQRTRTLPTAPWRRMVHPSLRPSLEVLGKLEDSAVAQTYYKRVEAGIPPPSYNGPIMLADGRDVGHSAEMPTYPEEAYDPSEKRSVFMTDGSKREFDPSNFRDIDGPEYKVNRSPPRHEETRKKCEALLAECAAENAERRLANIPGALYPPVPKSVLGEPVPAEIQQASSSSINVI
ncbi:MAG: hypothetical protein GY696_09450 [Gammaproteobacteria bacterium]|nr:hypothetical protein [Gammaproteobacteria bacterium]